jgi:hypothetical protein
MDRGSTTSGCGRIDDDDYDDDGVDDDDDGVDDGVGDGDYDDGDGDDGDDDDGDDDFARDAPSDRRDVTSQFCPATWSGNGWEPVVGEAGRLEIRYGVRRRKYRMVLRRGDRLEWPPHAGVARPAVTGPRGVIAAQLVGFDPDDTVDVTERLKKYAGPHHDFHAAMGYRVRLYDMFPSDSDLASRFRCLRVLFANLVMRDYDFGLDPMIEHPRSPKVEHPRSPKVEPPAVVTAPTES